MILDKERGNICLIYCARQGRPKMLNRLRKFSEIRFEFCLDCSILLTRFCQWISRTDESSLCIDFISFRVKVLLESWGDPPVVNLRPLQSCYVYFEKYWQSSRWEELMINKTAKHLITQAAYQTGISTAEYVFYNKNSDKKYTSHSSIIWVVSKAFDCIKKHCWDSFRKQSAKTSTKL